jgi:isoquinoline 1-oxidoreductase beta subunit
MRRAVFLTSTAALGAGLALAFDLTGCAPGPKRIPDAQPTAEPSVSFAPNAWLHLRTDGTALVLINKSEMGQGVATGMPMMVAEELDLPWDSVRVAFAPVAKEYNDPAFGDMTTGGSTSTNIMFPVMRGAGAAARSMLVTAAANQWNVPASQLTTKAGVVYHAESKRSAKYGDLAIAASTVPVPKTVKLKDTKDFTLIGTSPKRLDVADKSRGLTKYGIDTVVPGMVYANILKSPTFGGTVDTVDDSAARKVAGVIDVVKVSSGVAVVANNTWSAFAGRNALKVTWKLGAAGHADSKQLFADAEKLAVAGKGVPAGKLGDVDTATGKVLEATYRGPFLAHAAMEPMNATADVRDDGVTLWVPTQVQTRCQTAAMQITGFPAEKVVVNTTYLGGGFGRRLDPDYAVDAVEISKAVKKPVKVTWTREDDIKNDFYRPMSVNFVRARLAPNGAVTSFEHNVASDSIVRRWAPPLLKGGVDFSAVTSVVPDSYAFASTRTMYAETKTGVPTGFMRAPGANWNTFVVESFIDELAHAAGKDPLAFRLSILAPKATRERTVLEAAAKAAGWPNAPAGRKLGIALCFWDNSVAALVAEVSMVDKLPKVHKATIAADCGIVIHPDIVKAQLQGAVTYGLAMARTAKITLTDGKIDQSNFYDYTVLRMDDAPLVDVHIMRSDNTPTGIGELGTPPIAPAVANAVFALTGKRMRTLPFSDALA